MPEQTRRMMLRFAVVVVIYNIVLAAVIFWVAGRTADRFTGADGKRLEARVAHLEDVLRKDSP